MGCQCFTGSERNALCLFSLFGADLNMAWLGPSILVEQILMCTVIRAHTPGQPVCVCACVCARVLGNGNSVRGSGRGQEGPSRW